MREQPPPPSAVVPASVAASPLASAAIKTAAREAGFVLAGLTRAVALDPGPLGTWLGAGHNADMDWMARKVDQRLDPARVLAGARTVLALAIGYHQPDAVAQAVDAASAVARYARGADYHNAHRRRMRKLRKALLQMAPHLQTYACVDTGLAMEKVWAERAGLGFIGKNGCLINPRLGSWLTLSVMFLDCDVDTHDDPTPRACGSCTLCLTACPTGAFPGPGVVDARRCLSYQSIENQHAVPVELRPGFHNRVFGCDVCQDVCPYNRGIEARTRPGDTNSQPRPIALLPPESLVRLGRDQYEKLSAGSPLARPGHDGLRRNALLALGAAKDRSARATVLAQVNDPAEIVAEAARWALAQIDGV